jgi:hypothetical protein
LRGIRRSHARTCGFPTSGDQERRAQIRAKHGCAGRASVINWARHDPMNEQGLRMNTTTRELQADRWADYFGGLAAGRGDRLVSVEVMRERTCEQRYGKPWQLRAIGYDPVADVLGVAVGERRAGEAVVLRHFISGPRTITVEQVASPWPMAILVQDTSGVRTRIRVVPRAPVLRRPSRAGRASCATRGTVASHAPAAHRAPCRPRDHGNRPVESCG